MSGALQEQDDEGEGGEDTVVEWAAMHIDPDGARVPIGNACECCYRVAIDVLQYQTWDVFCSDVSADQSLKARALEIRDNLVKPGTHEVEQERVGKTIGTCLRIDRKVPGAIFHLIV